MRNLLALLLPLFLFLGVAQPAWAWPVPPSSLQVDNDSGFDVQVFVDGAFRGEVRHSDDRGFGTLPGAHQVTVRTEREGLVLLDGRVDVSPGRATRVVLTPPRTRLTLVNDGEAPLLVRLSHDSQPFWLVPGATQQSELPSGRVLVTTSVWTFEGLIAVDRRDLLLQPGRAQRETLGWSPRTLSRVTLSNDERSPLRIYVDGNEVAFLPPRHTREITLLPGRHLVAVVDASGRMLYNAPAVVAPRTDYDVRLGGGIVVTPRGQGVQVAWSR